MPAETKPRPWRGARRLASIAASIALTLACASLAAPAAPSLHLIERIAGRPGDYDYVAVDPLLRRVFIARSDGVMAIDQASGRVIDRLVAGRGISAVLPIPGTPLMLSTEFDADDAILFDRASGRVAARVKTGHGPDAAAYDPATGLAAVMNGKDASATLIDPRAARAVGTVRLGGKPEAAVADARGRLYVNIEDKAEIAVLDMRHRRVIARYPLKGCVEPTGIAYDPVSKLLISACHNGVARLVDARTGKPRGGFVIGRQADGVIFDSVRRYLFAPAFDGTLVMVSLDRHGRTRALAWLRTQVGARTAALDPRTGQLYLPTARYKHGATAEEAPLPDSFSILVVGTR